MKKLKITASISNVGVEKGYTDSKSWGMQSTGAVEGTQAEECGTRSWIKSMQKFII